MAGVAASPDGQNVMSYFEHFDARAGFAPATASLSIAQIIKSAALLTALLAYTIGFVLLYPMAQASVAKSVGEGNDPTALEFVSP
jgi:hypothetical protein